MPINLNDAHKITNKILTSAELEQVKQYKQALKEIQDILNNLELKDVLTQTDYYQYSRKATTERQILQTLKSLTGKNQKTIVRCLQNIYEENYYHTAFALESTSGLKLGFGLLSKDVIKKAIENPYKHLNFSDSLKEVESKLYKDITNSITQGLIKGEGYAKIAKNIENVSCIPANAKGIKGLNRAKLIVRTETHRVQNQAIKDGFNKSISAAERLGLKTKRIWDATLDEKTRPSHRVMDGKAANDEGLFSLNGVMVEGPGNTGIAEEDINCRCSTRLEIEGFETKSRLDNETKQAIPYQTYEEWYDNRINK